MRHHRLHTGPEARVASLVWSGMPSETIGRLDNRSPCMIQPLDSVIDNAWATLQGRGDVPCLV